jgi:fatty acid desaturase
MRKRRRLEEFRARIFRSPSERQQGRQDITSVLAFVARVAATAGAFAYCGWITAGDVAAGILGIGVFAVLIASSRGSLLGSVSHHG